MVFMVLFEEEAKDLITSCAYKCSIISFSIVRKTMEIDADGRLEGRPAVCLDQANRV